MARPKKRDDERLVPVTVYIRPSRYDALDRRAKAADKKLSEYLRERIDPVPLQQNNQPS